MKIANLSKRNLDIVSEGMVHIEKMRKEKEYLLAIKAIMGLMEMFEEDIVFHKALTDLREETKNNWKKEIEWKKRNTK